MTSRALVVTLMLTAAGVVLLVMQLGPGAPLFVAMLGGAAVWLLPAPLAIAMPAGAFGGVLLARAEQDVVDDEDSTGDTLRLAVLALVLSALTVGWLVPFARQETSRAVSRLVPDSVVEQTEVTPERLTLDQLVAGARSIPGAEEELLRRAGWIAPSFLAPLFAAVLIRVRARWRLREAVAAILVIFGISIRLAMGSVV